MDRQGTSGLGRDSRLLRRPSSLLPGSSPLWRRSSPLTRRSSTLQHRSFQVGLGFTWHEYHSRTSCSVWRGRSLSRGAVSWLTGETVILTWPEERARGGRQ